MHGMAEIDLEVNQASRGTIPVAVAASGAFLGKWVGT